MNKDALPNGKDKLNEAQRVVSQEYQNFDQSMRELLKVRNREIKAKTGRGKKPRKAEEI